MYCISCFSIR
uniref:Uncharacterized protein n=1 Tax=Arundo donax TaxID=35708 RepID=A0A0A9GY97_ARUDO